MSLVSVVSALTVKEYANQTLDAGITSVWRFLTAPNIHARLLRFVDILVNNMFVFTLSVWEMLIVLPKNTVLVAIVYSLVHQSVQ